MKKIEAWLSKKGLKNKRTLIVVIAFVLFIIFLFLLLNSNSEDSGNITITENAGITYRSKRCVSSHLQS
ncbi:LytH protein involved in methicillin resistance / N-acetylmuramoyl-L-alanine amidase domain protein [Staphylococcus aureus]|nr:LytH protein involved in methicillin resistance / N-acetylmuramoyl-L-alanine amidase domain protein [Staphylococcus aureus]